MNADAVVWNVRKVLDKASLHYDPSQVGWTAPRMPTLRSARKVDDMTVEFTTERLLCRLVAHRHGIGVEPGTCEVGLHEARRGAG